MRGVVRKIKNNTSNVWRILKEIKHIAFNV